MAKSWCFLVLTFLVLDSQLTSVASAQSFSSARMYSMMSLWDEASGTNNPVLTLSGLPNHFFLALTSALKSKLALTSPKFGTDAASLVGGIAMILVIIGLGCFWFYSIYRCIRYRSNAYCYTSLTMGGLIGFLIYTFVVNLDFTTNMSTTFNVVMGMITWSMLTSSIFHCGMFMRTGRRQTRYISGVSQKRLNILSILNCRPMLLSAVFVMVMWLSIRMSYDCRIGDGRLHTSCNSACPCGSGLSCHPAIQRCYHDSREVDEPCVGQNDCKGELTCAIPWQHKCSRGECGDLCTYDSHCGPGLECVVVGGINTASVCVKSCSGCSNTAKLANCFKQQNVTLTPVPAVLQGASYHYSTWHYFPRCRAEVLQQGCCGSCVAFGVSSAMATQKCVRDSIMGYTNQPNEWLDALATAVIRHRAWDPIGSITGSRYVRLSEEHLLACSLSTYQNTVLNSWKWTNWQDTCDGFDAGFEFDLVNALGIPVQTDMPYLEGERYFMSDTCQDDGIADSCRPQSMVIGKGCIKKNLYSFEEVKKFITENGAVAASFIPDAVGALDASVSVWYDNRILSSNGKRSTGHTVMASGYGVQDGTPYLVIHNSWGNGFGGDGEARIAYSAFTSVIGCALRKDAPSVTIKK